jgi:hypothetical protein
MVELVNAKSNLNDILILWTSGLVGMLKSQLKCTILILKWVGGNAKS